MEKIKSLCVRKVRQCCWALIAVFLVNYFTAASQVHASVQEDHIQRQSSFLIELDEDNWREMFVGEWMVEFFAPWCPACKNLAPIWERFATTASEINVNVAKIDVTTSPSLSGRFYVTALPTIYHVKDGEFRQYRGSRDGDALMSFLTQKQWSKLEPVSAWKKPNTLHMSVLSYFFKLSHTLKDLNGRLQEKYGLPTWGSYALFTVGTVFVGAALGLILVCIVDFIYPPKKLQRQSFSEVRENLRNDIEDIANDEIEDDRPTKNKEDNQANEENDEENEMFSTDDEKHSQSESEEGEQQQHEQQKSKKNAADDNKSNPAEIRKRKSRKAD